MIRQIYGKRLKHGIRRRKSVFILRHIMELAIPRFQLSHLSIPGCTGGINYISAIAGIPADGRVGRHLLYTRRFSIRYQYPVSLQTEVIHQYDAARHLPRCHVSCIQSWHEAVEVQEGGRSRGFENGYYAMIISNPDLQEGLRFFRSDTVSSRYRRVDLPFIKSAIGKGMTVKGNCRCVRIPFRLFFKRVTRQSAFCTISFSGPTPARSIGCRNDNYFLSLVPQAPLPDQARIRPSVQVP